jgi:hypothetical protein
LTAGAALAVFAEASFAAGWAPAGVLAGVFAGVVAGAGVFCAVAAAGALGDAGLGLVDWKYWSPKKTATMTSIIRRNEWLSCPPC